MPEEIFFKSYSKRKLIFFSLLSFTSQYAEKEITGNRWRGAKYAKNRGNIRWASKSIPSSPLLTARTKLTFFLPQAPVNSAALTKAVGVQFSLKYWLSMLCFCTLEELFLYAFWTKSNKLTSQTKWEHQCFGKKFYFTLLREGRWNKQTQLG